MPPTMTRAGPRREQVIVLGGLAGAIFGAWLYLLYLARDMDGAAMAAPLGQPWSAVDFFAMFAMWAAMMVAMMLPSAAPMVLLFARIGRKQRQAGRRDPTAVVFVLGYLLVWSGFSLLATALQWGLHSLMLLSPTMQATSPILGGALLIAAGAYQFTPLKHACLGRCRSPLGFLMTRWRPGTGGALVMGLDHGAFCVGCCWALMALLFVGGVMNLLWVAAIALFVLIEKLAPQGGLIARIGGAVLILAGGVLIFTAWSGSNS